MTEVSKWFEEKEALCMDQLWEFPKQKDIKE